MSNNQEKRRIVTGKVRLSYEHIWEPYAHQEGEKEKYSASLIIPKSDKETLGKIKVAIEAAKKDGESTYGGKIPANLKLPLRDGDEDRPDDEAYEDSYFINCSSNRQPGIVDKTRKPILDREEVYSGCYILASITFYPFNSNGNKGVAVALNNIMKVADGESLTGDIAAETEFAEINVKQYVDDDDLL